MVEEGLGPSSRRQAEAKRIADQVDWAEGVYG